MIQSVRAALRQLKNHRSYTLGAMLSLAIGMSLGTAVYSVVDTIWFQPLPYGDSDNLAVFTQESPVTHQRLGSGTAKMLLQLRAEATAFSHVAASRYAGVYLENGERPVSVRAEAVTPNYFETMRMRPMLGRVFRTGDVAGTGDVVISHRLWTTKFGSDSSVVGRTVGLKAESARDDGEQLRIVGILEPRAEIDGTHAWVLMSEASIVQEASAIRDVSWCDIVARLAPGATLSDAGVQANAIFRAIYHNDPVRSGRVGVVNSIRWDLLIGSVSGLGLWLAAAILILILCAVNFATMTMARGMRRRGEIAVRAALGASKLDIVRALVTEALLIAAASGAISVVVASWLLSYSARVLGQTLPVPPTISWGVVTFGVLATMAVGFVFSVAPATELAKVDLRSVLQGSSASSTVRGRDEFGRRLLVGLQLCLALTAVATTTAVIQADRRVYGLETVIDYENLVFTNAWTKDTAAHLLGDAMHERLLSTPGVGKVAYLGRISAVIVWDNAGEAVDWPRNYVTQASMNLFDVLGVRLIAGRLPTEEEQLTGDGLVISESLARRLGGSASGAVGRRFRMKLARKGRDWTTVVGVVPDLGSAWVGTTVYWLNRNKMSAGGSYVSTVTGSPPVRARELGDLVKGGDSRIRVSSNAAITMMDERRAMIRGRLIFLVSIASLALVLAIVGVYGMTSYAAEARLREFGIRIALGANATRILKAMYNDLWWMAPVGIGLGLLAAGRVTAYLDALYRNPMMPQPLIVLHAGPTVATAVTLAVIAAIGTAMPLRRVLRLDVMRAVTSQ